MKLQYCSDLHLEFPDNKEYILDNPIEPTSDILILAGDIVPFAVMDKPRSRPNPFGFLPGKARICKTEYSSQKRGFVLTAIGNFLMLRF